MTASYDLRFGSIDMSPAAQINDVEYRVYGLRRGYPAPSTVVVNSMLQDGADERVDRYENRDQQIVIGLKAADSDLLAEAESALFLECQRERNELAWMPPDGFGATTVFDVLWSSLEFQDVDDWDLKESHPLRDCERVYLLTVRALPFGRSGIQIIDEGLASGGSATSTTISDGTSTTNWTGTSAITATGGWLRQTRPTTMTLVAAAKVYSASGDYTYAAMSPLDFGDEPFLTVDYKYITGGTGGTTTIRAFADGVEVPQVATQVLSTDRRQATFVVTDVSVSSLRFQLGSQTYFPRYASGSLPSVDFEIDNVVMSNQAPNASPTGRQALKTVPVTGSARSLGALSVEHETAALGDVIVYACPSLSDAALGYQPDLRRWRTAGNTPSAYDSALVSGYREDVASSGTIDVPAAALPRGTYLLMGRLRATTADKTLRVRWSASTRAGSSNLGTRTQTSPVISLTTGAWSNVPLGTVTLAPLDVTDSSTALVRLHGWTTLNSSASGSFEWDEMWLFYLGGDWSLTVGSLGAGSPSIGVRHNRLWIDSASLSTGLPSVWMGTSADRTDSISAGAACLPWMPVTMQPPSMNVFVVTSGAQNPLVSVIHDPHWHTHARQIEAG